METQTVIASNQPEPQNIAVSGGTVYWSNAAIGAPGATTINKAPVGGGGQTTLFTGRFGAQLFVLDGSNLFFYEQTALKRMAASGGAFTMLANEQGNCPDGQMVAAAGVVTWIDSCSNGIYQFGP